LTNDVGADLLGDRIGCGKLCGLTEGLTEAELGAAQW